MQEHEIRAVIKKILEGNQDVDYGFDGEDEFMTSHFMAHSAENEIVEFIQKLLEGKQ